MVIKRKSLLDLYFISSIPGLDNEIIHPIVPINFFTRNKIGDYKTPRIRLYPSIDDALTSLSGFSTELKNKEFYLYIPRGIFKESLVKPSILQVPDSQITNEYWYLKNLRLSFKAKVRVLGKDGKKFIYHYGPRSTEDMLYRWSWEEVLKPWEKSKL